MKYIKTFEGHNDDSSLIKEIEKSKPINDYEIDGYDEEGVIGDVNIYLYNDKKYHIVQWLSHSEKGEKKEILKKENK